jgi:hypothetical protein
MESMKDTAQVLGRIFDGIEYRGFAQKSVEILGEFAGVPGSPAGSIRSPAKPDPAPTRMVRRRPLAVRLKLTGTTQRPLGMLAATG